MTTSTTRKTAGAVAACIAVASLAAALACSEPTNPKILHKVRSDAGAPSLDLPIDPQSGSGEVALQSFDSLTWVDITASGTVTATPTSQGGTPRTWGPRGMYWSDGVTVACVVKVAIEYTVLQGPSSFENGCDSPPNSPVSTVTIRARVKGTGKATRLGPLPRGSETYSGSQTITVRPVTSPKIRVTASLTQIDAGDEVTFQASMEPPSTVDYMKISWWESHADDSVHSDFNHWGWNLPYHKADIKWSGFTLAVGSVNDMPASDSVHVTVREPPEWTLVTNKISYRPQEWVTYSLRFTSGDTIKWYPRTNVSGWHERYPDGTLSGGYWPGYILAKPAQGKSSSPAPSTGQAIGTIDL